MRKKIGKAGEPPKAKRRRAVFRLDAPEAGEVFLVGNFNDWDVRRHRMKREENGVWKKITLLFPGRYEYKFLVDHEWWTDPANDQVCWNRFGTQNNVLEVKAGLEYKGSLKQKEKVP